MHPCFAPDCAELVRDDLLMCRRHWYRVPLHLRRAVWAAYRGPGPGSGAHTAAIMAARRSLA